MINKKQILIGVTLMTVMTLTSCKQNELLYSCDPEVNKWATLNSVEINSMTRMQFIELNEIYQKAAFNVFTPQQRMNLWKTKLEEILQLEWAANEREHIEVLLDMVVKNYEWFKNDRSQEVMDHFALETYKWIDYAFINLLWDYETIFLITQTPMSVYKNNGKLVMFDSQFADSGTQREMTREGDCTCKGGNSWSDLNCTISNGTSLVCKKNDKCSPKPTGCGTFWCDPCDGVCSNPLDAIDPGVDG